MADKTIQVYTCTGTASEAPIALTTYVYPTCSPASAGQWETVVVKDPIVVSDLLIEGMVISVGILLLAMGFMSGKQR